MSIKINKPNFKSMLWLFSLIRSSKGKIYKNLWFVIVVHRSFGLLYFSEDITKEELGNSRWVVIEILTGCGRAALCRGFLQLVQEKQTKKKGIIHNMGVNSM